MRLGFIATTWPLDEACFAHRAFWARLIFLRAAAESVCLGFVTGVPPFNLPSTDRAASKCLSRLTRFVRFAPHSATIDTNPLRCAMVPPLMILAPEVLRPYAPDIRSDRHRPHPLHSGAGAPVAVSEDVFTKSL